MDLELHSAYLMAIHAKTRSTYNTFVLAMDNIHGCYPRIISMDNIHGHYPWIICMDITHDSPPDRPDTSTPVGSPPNALGPGGDHAMEDRCAHLGPQTPVSFYIIDICILIYS